MAKSKQPKAEEKKLKDVLGAFLRVKPSRNSKSDEPQRPERMATTHSGEDIVLRGTSKSKR